jgi:N6-adenosine-specific RNA methylase IME4
VSQKTKNCKWNGRQGHLSWAQDIGACDADTIETPRTADGEERKMGGIFAQSGLLNHVGKYQVIYADPAWSYRDKASAGKRGAAYKYMVTDTASICRLEVREIAAANSACFMWATFPMLADALQVMEAWGFEYKSAAFVWVKTNKKSDADFFGMGNWTRANAEVCLLGIRGRPKRISASVRQVIRRPIMRHSEKPPEIRDRIVALMGNVPRVELFARTRTPGRDVWGNEIEYLGSEPARFYQALKHLGEIKISFKPGTTPVCDGSNNVQSQKAA